MFKILRIIFIFSFFHSFIPILNAKHIVGGEITYRYVSTSGNIVTLAFTMHVYRDCNATGGAPFDGEAVIGIFEKGNSKIKNKILVPLKNSVSVTPPSYQCLIPPAVCVEEGLYEWQSSLVITADSVSYIVEYQRCCRNNTITNINTPGQVGATYSVEISALALQLKNSSPVFKAFPPTIVCGDLNLKFDHSAKDLEGDQIVYRFCSPIGGGGSMTQSDCAGTTPNPPCYPAGGIEISFKTPDYSFDAPLGGNPIVKIDPNTGLITGKPMVQGQFVVGVCADEYRDGRLLSALRRDFQFNVADCKPKISAIVKADTVINKNYILNTCGVKALTISNLSFDRNNVKESFFDVQLGANDTKFTDWEPAISFPDTGVFRGKFYINPGTDCADTIDLTFNVFSAATSNFNFKYDTCVAGAVAFSDKSFSSNGKIQKWAWDFGDGAISNVSNPNHLYKTPGAKAVFLHVVDNKLCAKDTSLGFKWQPAPATIIIEPTAFNGCTPLTVLYNNLSSPIDSTYKIVWSFSDSTVSDKINPTKLFDKAGDYSVNIKITSPIGCSVSKNFPKIAKVRQGAKADFDFAPTRVTSVNNTVNFFDKSTNASVWYWYFNARGYSQTRNPTFLFRDTGLQKVTLIASNVFNCTDTIIKFLDVEPLVTYYLPTAFSPNNDNRNDFYKGVGITDGMEEYKMSIWNRWGERIYNTENLQDGWNGKKNNSGEDVPQGVYLCVVNYLTPRGQQKEIRTYVTLIR